MNNERKILRKKIDLFFKEKIETHLIKTNKFFYYGFIQAFFVSNDCYLITDREDGDQYVFFEEIYDVQPFREFSDKEDKEWGNF